VAGDSLTRLRFWSSSLDDKRKYQIKVSLLFRSSPAMFELCLVKLKIEMRFVSAFSIQLVKTGRNSNKRVLFWVCHS